MAKFDILPESVTCIEGGPLSGKTTFLASEAVRMASDGDRVLVICATPASADTLRARLADEPGHDAITVLHDRDAALRVVTQPEAESRLGRRGALLDDVEVKLLREDLKSTSVKKKQRLNEIWDFVNYSWANLELDSQVSDDFYEELTVLTRIHDCLDFTGGYLPDNLSFYAVRSLQADADLTGRLSYDHVLVDDFTRIDLAGQTLACLLAARSLTVAGDSTPCTAICHNHPNFAGIGQLAASAASPRLVNLEGGHQADAVRGTLAKIRAYDPLEGARKGVPAGIGSGDGVQAEAPRWFMAEDMGGETRALASVAKQVTDAGMDLCIVGTNGAWRRNVMQALENYGLKVRKGGRKGTKPKDLLDKDDCFAIKDACLARLAADPEDGLAWRSILGLGDYVGRSAAIEALRDAALPQGMRLPEALEAMVQGRLSFPDSKVAVVQQLQDIYRQVQEELSSFSPSAAPAQPTNAPEGPCITVCGPRDVLGDTLPVIVFGGFVNGLIPSDKYLDPTVTVGHTREFQHARDVQLLYAVASRAKGQLMFTGFTSCSLETAERLKLKIKSIKLRKGIRTALLEPSELLQIML